MLGVTSGSELFWNSEGSNFKKKKWHVNLDSITFQRKSHKNFHWKINFGFTLKLPEILGASTFYH